MHKIMQIHVKRITWKHNNGGKYEHNDFDWVAGAKKRNLRLQQAQAHTNCQGVVFPFIG